VLAAPRSHAHNVTMKRVTAKKTSRTRLGMASERVSVRGKRVPRFGDDFVLIRTGRFESAKKSTLPSEETRVLARRVGQALAKPGISQAKKHRTLYSADPHNPSRIVRTTADGRTSVGRLVGDRFRIDD
jgi:hypothetical protein